MLTRYEGQTLQCARYQHGRTSGSVEHAAGAVKRGNWPEPEAAWARGPGVLSATVEWPDPEE
jgi:hypothetical protein